MDSQLMRQVLVRVAICGFHDRDSLYGRQLTHMIVVANPKAVAAPPEWFNGAFLSLYFGDVLSESDARLCKTNPPNPLDIQRALEFFRDAWSDSNSRILISCDYGASRSPALAYLCIADLLGPGQEADALRLTLKLCPGAIPNGMVVRLGDTLLSRRGTLVEVLKKLFDEISAEWSFRPLREE